MIISDLKQLSSIYRIEDGVIYYKYGGKEYSRRVCREIVLLLTKRRRVVIRCRKRCLVVLYENELASINSYIMGWDREFKMQHPYPKGKEIIRAVGSIEIKNSNKIKI